MSLAIIIILYTVSVFEFVWATNLSFAAHFQEETKGLIKYHVGSAFIFALAVAQMATATYMIGG